MSVKIFVLLVALSATLASNPLKFIRNDLSTLTRISQKSAQHFHNVARRKRETEDEDEEWVDMDKEGIATILKYFVS